MSDKTEKLDYHVDVAELVRSRLREIVSLAKSLKIPELVRSPATLKQENTAREALEAVRKCESRIVRAKGEAVELRAKIAGLTLGSNDDLGKYLDHRRAIEDKAREKDAEADGERARLRSLVVDARREGRELFRLSRIDGEGWYEDLTARRKYLGALSRELAATVTELNDMGVGRYDTPGWIPPLAGAAVTRCLREDGSDRDEIEKTFELEIKLSHTNFELDQIEERCFGPSPNSRPAARTPVRYR
jgi:hypothetical protein